MSSHAAAHYTHTNIHVSRQAFAEPRQQGSGENNSSKKMALERRKITRGLPRRTPPPPPRAHGSSRAYIAVGLPRVMGRIVPGPSDQVLWGLPLEGGRWCGYQCRWLQATSVGEAASFNGNHNRAPRGADTRKPATPLWATNLALANVHDFLDGKHLLHFLLHLLLLPGKLGQIDWFGERLGVLRLARSYHGCWGCP